MDKDISPDKLVEKPLHSEGISMESHAQDLSTASVDYWMARRTEAENFYALQSHVANERVLSIPASFGPSIAIASVAVATVGQFSKTAQFVIFGSAIIMVAASAVAFILFFYKNDICVAIVEHIKNSKRRFVRGEITLNEVFYNKRYVFSDKIRIIYISMCATYFISAFGIAIGFGIEIHLR